MAVSPLFWNNGRGLQLSLSRIALDSLIPLMHCASRHVEVYLGEKKKPSGILEMLLKGCGCILYRTVKHNQSNSFFSFLFPLH